MVKPPEMQYWKHITPCYVTEESDNSNDEMAIVEHKLVWRSPRKGVGFSLYRKNDLFTVGLDKFMTSCPIAPLVSYAAGV